MKETKTFTRRSRLGPRATSSRECPFESLIQALERVHAGGRFLPVPIKRALASRTPDSDLSHRERQVLELLARGNSNKRIGELLGITEATVKSHVQYDSDATECSGSHAGCRLSPAARLSPHLKDAMLGVGSWGMEAVRFLCVSSVDLVFVKCCRPKTGC